MKRLVVTVLALGLFLLSAIATAGTETTLTGTAEWATQSTTIHGTFAGKLGRGTYAGTLNGGDPFTSSDCGPVCEPVTGAIVFSAKRGEFTAVVQPGSVVALVDIASHSWRNFTLTLAIASGTRSYAHARGTLTLSYTSAWEHQFADGVFISAISDSGTLSGKPH
jgi:hypothetical protein